MLFTVFNEVLDKSQKKKIIDIARETTVKMAENLIFQLDHVTTNTPEVVVFLMHWDTTIEKYESDTEFRGKIWEQEKLVEDNVMFQQLEQRIEKKNADLVAHLDRWSWSMVNLIDRPYA